MPALDRAVDLLRRAISARPAFGILCVAYAVVLLIIMMPVLVSTVGADDMYFTLASIEAANGSVVNAVTVHLGDIFLPDTTNEQPRTAPLAIAARRALAVIVLSAAVTFSLPLAAMWFLSKVVLLLVTIASVAALLWQVRFRAGNGEVRGIRRSTMSFILLAVPLAIALGIKAQVVGGLNSWIHYPVLTYGAVPVIFSTVALCLWLLRKLETGYRAWVWPAVASLALVAFVLNYSYEIVAVAIPVAIVATVMHPRSTALPRWAAWKPAATVGGALGGVFTALFVFNRWRLSTWDCVQDGSCYGGSTLEINPRTLLLNFAGALPSSVTPTIEAVMRETGRSLPPVFTGWGVAVGLLAVLLLAAAWAAWIARRRTSAVPSRAGRAIREEKGHDSRGLLVVIVVSAMTGIGVSVVSGITSRAVSLVQTAEIAYRSGVAVWTCIALIGVIAVRLWLVHVQTRRRWVVAASVGGLVVVAIAHLLPLNLGVAQAERAAPPAQVIDAIHWDIVLGDLTPVGEATRCANAARYIRVLGSNQYFIRTINSANTAFEYIHGMPYCSTPAE